MPNLLWSACSIMDDGFHNSYIDSIDVSGWEFNIPITLDRLFMYTELGSATGGFDIDLSTWVGTSNITSMSQFIKSCRTSFVDATNLDTSNVTNMYQFAYQATFLTHITGLDTFDSSSIVSVGATSSDGVVDFFRDCNFYDFDQPNANFGGNWGPNFNPSLLSLIRFFKRCGNLGAGVNPPNVSDWNVSNIQRFDLMFSYADWSSTNNPDISLWDVSSATHFTEFARRSGISALDTSNWEISNSCTSMISFVEDSAFSGTLDFSHINCDFSGVTSFHSFAKDVDLTGFKLNATADFSGSFSFSSFSVNGSTPLSTVDYDYFLGRLAATGMIAAIILDMGDANYTLAAAPDRATLTTTKGWTVNDGGI